MARIAKLLRTSTVVVLVTLAAASAAYAAYTASSNNPANGIVAGTVTISDDDGGSAAVSLSGADGGDASTGCIDVRYTGSLPANVRIRGTVTGALADQLELTITRGSGAAGFPGCGSFSPDAADYIGQGAGVVYRGALSGLGSSWATGVLDPPGATQETWQQDERHVYRIRVAVPTNGALQGLGPATAQLVWEARGA